MNGAQNEESRTRLRIDPDEGRPGEAVGFGRGRGRGGVTAGAEQQDDENGTGLADEKTSECAPGTANSSHEDPLWPGVYSWLR